MYTGHPTPNPFEAGDPFVACPQTGAIVPHESNPFGTFEPQPNLMMAQPNTFVDSGFDDNVHVDGTTSSVVEVSSGFGSVTIMGTFNGIVLLLLDKDMLDQLIPYNPFTRVSKMLPKPGYNCLGFGYGATKDDLKIVRLISYYYQILEDYDVFSFKNSSWEKVKRVNIQGIRFRYGDVGKFFNGFLYWIGYSELDKVVIVALNVTEMVLLKINPPLQFSSKNSPLGMIDGCLCIIQKSGERGFNVWVLKEQGVESSWTKTCGRILIMDYSYQLIIYYTSNGSFKKLNLPEELRCEL
nr:hypothetical protein [Tanacetum cinerariifolium]